jgi:hypothetical protein
MLMPRCCRSSSSSATIDADHHVGLGGERPRDRDALPLSPGEPAGLVVQHARPEGHLVHELDHAVGGRLALGETEQLHRPPDDLLDGQAGVQRQVRVLEDVLHPPAVLGTPSTGALGQLAALERQDARPVLVQPAHRAGDRGLAAAGLADQRHHLTLREVQ